MVEKEAKQKSDFEEQVNYIVGLGSIIFAFINPLMGFILSIIGLVLAKDAKTNFLIKAKKFSIIGLVLSVLMTILIFIALYYYQSFIGSQIPLGLN